jgi:hypothetical protein
MFEDFECRFASGISCPSHQACPASKNPAWISSAESFPSIDNAAYPVNGKTGKEMSASWYRCRSSFNDYPEGSAFITGE